MNRCLTLVVVALLPVTCSLGADVAKQPTPATLPEFVRVKDTLSSSGRTATITLEFTRRVPKTHTESRISTKNGKEVLTTVSYIEYVFFTEIEKVSAKDFRLITVDGKDVDWAKAKGKVVVKALSPTGLDEAYKTLLTGDTLVIVPIPVKPK